MKFTSANFFYAGKNIVVKPSTGCMFKPSVRFELPGCPLYLACYALHSYHKWNQMIKPLAIDA